MENSFHTEKQISKLERDVDEIKGKMSDMDKELLSIKGDVTTILQLVQKMDAGLYGDSKNKHEGVIDRQHYLEEQIDKLKEEIAQIHKKNNDQDVEIKAKRTLRVELVEYGRELGKWVINIIVMYLIFKGLIDADAMLK
jgi:chromosome segregation ATPase